jgi:hypothetical protein
MPVWSRLFFIAAVEVCKRLFYSVPDVIRDIIGTLYLKQRGRAARLWCFDWNDVHLETFWECYSLF